MSQSQANLGSGGYRIIVVKIMETGPQGCLSLAQGVSFLQLSSRSSATRHGYGSKSRFLLIPSKPKVPKNFYLSTTSLQMPQVLAYDNCGITPP